MHKMIAAALAAGMIAGSGGALSQSGDDLLKAKGCLGCHDWDKKKVGPSYKDIAAKHKGNAGAEGALVAKLKDGKGHMKINAPEADIKAAVQTVLSAK